jgi:hypothetical protein
VLPAIVELAVSFKEINEDKWIVNSDNANTSPLFVLAAIIGDKPIYK